MTDHVGTALRDRRYALSPWPWRSALHLTVTAVIAAPLACCFALMIIPWVVAVRSIGDGRPPRPAVVVLMVVGAALLLAGGPLVALPLAALERRRLRLIDRRPLPVPHRAAGPDPITWLAARYRDESTWRAALYLLLLCLLAPPLYFAGTMLVLLEMMLLLSPGLSDWTLGDYRIDGGPGSIPLCLLGIALIPVFLHLAGGMAAAHGALVRKLLGGNGDRLRDRLTEVAQSRARLADAFDAERRRIERDLHDGAQHRLTSLTLHLGMARLDLPDGSPAAGPLHQAHDQAKELMVVLRDLVHGIRPQTLTDLGLPAALWELAAGSPVPVTVDAAEFGGRLPERIETTAYFVVAEALTNVAKHARATSARVRLNRAGDGITLEILDDGQGGADPAAGTGLTGLADRVAAAGGRLLLASPAGGPTLLRVELP